MPSYAPTFADVKAAVIAKLRLDSTDDATRVGEWINSALTEAASESKWFTGGVASSALAANASSVALPASIIDLDFVTRTYGGQTLTMTEVGYDRILNARGLAAAVGPPSWYTLRQSTIEFYPPAVGGEVITAYGAILPDALTGTNALPIPEPYGSKLLEYGALVEGAQFKKDPLLGEYEQKKAEWRQRFLAYVTRRQGNQGLTFRVRTPLEPIRWPHPSIDVPWTA